jgi:UDP-N-acetylmuramoylalanine--D-glutamate ligase
VTLKNLQNKKIAILGLGTENYWLVKYLLRNKVSAEITICSSGEVRQDERYADLKKVKQIKWLNFANQAGALDSFNILFRSPGWPIFCPAVQSCLKHNPKTTLTSPMKLFFDLCPTKNIIGVTGTKGKGTTASLIYAILKEDKKSVYLGGNIGIAPFEFLPKLSKTDFVILELSSFQLEDLHKSPHIAVFTNFTAEHLAPADPSNPNYHRNLKGYWESKVNIARVQKSNDFFVVNERLELRVTSYELRSQLMKGRKIFFTKSDWPSQLVGEHNKENVAAAEVVAQILKISPETVARAVKKFKGLEHRLELVAEHDNIKYYDDSFATTPESTIIALKSFPFDKAQGKSIVLLAGGADKGANFKKLATEIKKRVKYLILFDGLATPRIKQELLAIDFPVRKIKITRSMSDAVRLARLQSKSGDIVLLSTACASFGIFKNYKERGNLFKKEVITPITALAGSRLN